MTLDGKIKRDTWERFEPARSGDFEALARKLESEIKEIRPVEFYKPGTEIYEYAVTYWPGFKNPLTSEASTKKADTKLSKLREDFKDKLTGATMNEFRKFYKETLAKLDEKVKAKKNGD